MKILVLGSGLMGPAAAWNALADDDVTHVTLADMDRAQLEMATAKLAKVGSVQKLSTAQVDLNQATEATRLIGDYDVVLAALPSAISGAGARAAAAAGTPWVDLSWPAPSELDGVRQAVAAAGTLAIFGCGVEPGLTEIMARYLAEKLDRVDELHIKCGGIPEAPAPPLGYKIVFGGRRLPLREQDAQMVEWGELKAVPRYSGVETVVFSGVGECEAWHEGFMPWLLDLDALKGLKIGTQKTVRWPGFAAKITVLKDLGLLSYNPVEVNGVAVAPKHMLDVLLYPHVKLGENERDITTFRVDALGTKKLRPRQYTIEMVDRFDEKTGFTSMARVTAFTGAIIARMVARGDIKTTGVRTPETVVTGKRLRRLVKELAAEGVRFTATVQKAQSLD